MKKYQLKRALLLTGLCMILNFAFVFAESRLFVIIATQNVSDIGSPIDHKTILNLTQEIRQFTGKTVIVFDLDAGDASETKLDQILTDSKLTSQDAVWFYYSGHGVTFDGWPTTDQTNLKETWVHDRLKSTGARLSLVTYDCCNWDEPIQQYPPGLQPKSVNFISLFFESRGNYISTSSNVGQYSYGSKQTGGMYTNVLVDALKNENSLNWESVFTYVKEKTQRICAESGKTQDPIYASENTGMEQPVAAPSLRIRENDTVDGIIKKLEKLIKDTESRNVKITSEDLKRWNPGFNGSNLRNWVGKKFNYIPDDPKIKR
jgi:hypothetical protein